MARTTLADLQTAIRTAQEAGARVERVRLPPLDHELVLAEVDHTTLKRSEACEALKVCATTRSGPMTSGSGTTGTPHVDAPSVGVA